MHWLEHGALELDEAVGPGSCIQANSQAEVWHLKREGGEPTLVDSVKWTVGRWIKGARGFLACICTRAITTVTLFFTCRIYIWHCVLAFSYFLEVFLYFGQTGSGSWYYTLCSHQHN